MSRSPSCCGAKTCRLQVSSVIPQPWSSAPPSPPPLLLSLAWPQQPPSFLLPLSKPGPHLPWVRVSMCLAYLCACLKLKRPVCYHSVPLTAIMVSAWVYVCVCLHSWFCVACTGSTSQTRQLCSPTASQCVMRARPFDVRTSCSYRWTLYCFHLLFCQSTGYTHTHTHTKPDPKSNCCIDCHICDLLSSVCVCVCLVLTDPLSGCRDFVKATPRHYPFNVPLTADSSIYGTGPYLPIKPFIVWPGSMVAVTWFSHFLWGPSLYHGGGGGQSCPPSVFTKVWPTHKSITAGGILEIPQQRKRKWERDGGGGGRAYCIACNRPHSTALS